MVADCASVECDCRSQHCDARQFARVWPNQCRVAWHGVYGGDLDHYLHHVAMALTVQNGSLVVRDGAIATGQGCCCGGGGGCSGPCDAENPCPPGCVCIDGKCFLECATSGAPCPQEGYACCPQMVAIVNNRAVYKHICLPYELPELSPMGRCCFNYGANCVDTTEAFCLCSFDGVRGVEVIFTAGASCADGCGNPFP